MDVTWRTYKTHIGFVSDECVLSRQKSTHRYDLARYRYRYRYCTYWYIVCLFCAGVKWKLTRLVGKAHIQTCRQCTVLYMKNTVRGLFPVENPLLGFKVLLYS